MRWVALLRAVNVGSAKLPMAELREVCAGLGWRDARTYVQSGNVVFEAKGEPQELEAALEQAVEKAFGFARPVMVRSADQWRGYAAGSPFPEAEAEAPSQLTLCLSKLPLVEGAAAALQERARTGEVILERDGALWAYFPGGIGTSKLTPALFDKAAGSPVTARNWRTVIKLQEMLASG